MTDLQLQVEEARQEAEDERYKATMMEHTIEEQRIENEKLRRQIEVITQLKSSDCLRSQEMVSQTSQSELQVDCDWSQQQMYASDVSVKERILQEISECGKEEPTWKRQEVLFYNPMPHRVFSKFD